MVVVRREAVKKHVYDADFFAWLDRNAQISARRFIQILAKCIPIKSVLDVGCGRGMWLSEWRLSGVDDTYGLDGDYVDRTALLVPQESFRPHDLNEPFDLGRKFDLVESLEVGEHLRETSADAHVASLVRHSEIVLFSASQPGQGGEFHINEQPHEYWREKFRNLGYYPFDYIRPLIKDNKEVGYYYRYNAIIYATKAASDRFPPDLQSSAIPNDQKIANVAPLGWRLRSEVFRHLPVNVITKLSRMRYRATHLLGR